MPMLWSNSGDKTSAFQSTVTQGYASWAMGFNECVYLLLCPHVLSVFD